MRRSTTPWVQAGLLYALLVTVNGLLGVRLPWGDPDTRLVLTLAVPLLVLLPLPLVVRRRWRRQVGAFVLTAVATTMCGVAFVAGSIALVALGLSG